jgi:uncharacterized OB-fold protein
MKFDPCELTPLRADLFVLDQDGAPLALRGSRCEVCGRSFFPARHWCSHCFSAGRLVDWTLPGRGVVHASTVVRVRSAVGHAAPYAYGYVSLGDGAVRIFAPFAEDAPDSFEPGRSVQLRFGRIPADGISPTLGYCCVPAPGNR